MGSLSKDSIRQILNLRSGDLISDSVAERQLEVIRKGFNFLNQPENNVIYIGDEVGLGKTYIALGIASLLRHFSSNPESYQDMIIVPKENLQHKWQKEIRQFVTNNYLLIDNKVKSIIGKPVGEINVVHKLGSINNEHPAYHIYRNSQFSLGFSHSKKAQVKEDMLCKLAKPEAKEILEDAFQNGYYTQRSALKKLFAYLLSAGNPDIELLIVDEGHNYKHGLGETDDDEVSDRNNVICRFLGLKKDHQDDKDLFQFIPGLSGLVQPKVKKLIVLSATPKTYSLLELRNQLDCFVGKHILKGMKKEAEVKEKLSSFVIRGNMEYKVGEKLYTRNLCRLEHRRGNVEKVENAPELLIGNNEQAMILGLLQYGTIKHLDAKNNASFEIGMLAGFETFSVDQNRIYKSSIEEKEETKEYEETRSRKVRKSQDEDIVSVIIDSYKKEFGEAPPHPKQDAIVNATCGMMQRGEKSLIFVRRVASAYELESRLLCKWEDEVYSQLSTKWVKQLGSVELNNLLRDFKDYRHNKELTENLDKIFNELTDKLLVRNAFDFSFLLDGKKELTELIRIGLFYLYEHREDEKFKRFYELLCEQCSRKHIMPDLSIEAYNLLRDTVAEWINTETGEEEAEDESYFFHAYFRKPSTKSFRKSRVYKTDWFHLNYFRLNEAFKIAHFKLDALTSDQISANDPNDIKEVQDIFLKNVLNEPYQLSIFEKNLFPETLVEKSTLITELLISNCEAEMSALILKMATKSREDVFREIQILVAIIRSCLRNGSGFLPLYIADKAQGYFIKNYQLIIETEGTFQLVLSEIKSIINDYFLLKAVNFPDGESIKTLESKLVFQSPVVGLSGTGGRSKTNVATQFRMPGFPYILVTTDVFREGEDLHTYCDNIYHYGIAWNCSDMEQRTGRIDRINSKSHRKMNASSELTFDNRVHVFYPYLKNTLEVNQVNHLFNSINSFVRTFNDFTENIPEDSVVMIADAIEKIQPVIDQPLHSKYEHNYFAECTGTGELIISSDCIGMCLTDLHQLLIELHQSLQARFLYHNSVVLDRVNFALFGDIRFPETNRRGPFKLLVRNDTQPGEFFIEAHAYLFKVSNRIIRSLDESLLKESTQFKRDSIEDYFSLTFSSPVIGLNSEDFMVKLYVMVQQADKIERLLTDDLDIEVFG